MKILKRKTLAALLALSLLASLLPLGAQPALAAENAPTTLYVGNYQITNLNATTYLKAGSTQGSLVEGSENDWTVKYEPTSATLTLKNATIKGVSNNINTSGAGIYAASSSGPVSLNIVLEEENKVSGMYGIDVSSSGGDASLNISGSGSLTVSGLSGNGIGIFMSSQNSANLTIEEASVTALGSQVGGSGVRLITSQTGSPSLTIEVEGGSLQASGETNGIHFLSNVNGATAVANLKVSGNAMVKASSITTTKDGTGSAPELKPAASGSDGTGGIIWDGKSGTVYGKVTLQENLTIESGQTLTIPEESSLTIPDDKMLTVNGGELTGKVPQSGVAYKVTDVSLNKTSLTLTDGGSETLTATITPSNATNKNVTWSSDNQNVATVSDGVVTAVSPGSAKITATADGKSDTCTVTVTAKTYSLSVDPSTLNFGSITEGDTLPAAQTVMVKNTGNQTVTLDQPAAENFEIGALSAKELKPDESATFTIQPKDNLPRGSYSEQITISGNDGASATLTASFTVKEPPYTGKYSYELSTSVGDHGSLTVDRYATEGEKVTITVTPDEAYKLDDLSVTAGGKEVALTAGGDGTFSFTMPSADVKISATFAEDPDWTEPEEPVTDVSDIFLDVTPNAWYKDAVQYAYAGGLMTGVSANEFAPEATTTRAMIVSMLARLEGVESAESAGFVDVAADDWYATAVNWAAASGITSGTGDGNFSPNTAITREQLAAILMNYAQYKGQDVSARATLDTYNDATAISSWANDVMSWAVAEGLLTGVTADTLQPQGAATRAQVAAILQRFLSE